MKKIIRIGVGLLLISFFSFSMVGLAGSASGQTDTDVGFVDGPPDPPVIKPKPKPPIDNPQPVPGIRLPQTGEEIALTIIGLGGLLIFISGGIVMVRKRERHTATRRKNK